MQNCLLVIVFNFHRHIYLKDFLRQYYSGIFSRILFYADIVDNGQSSDECIQVPIGAGSCAYRVLIDIFHRYRNLVDESEGVFYTMDDCVFNVKMLRRLQSDKILYYCRELRSVEEYHGWHWDEPKWGKSAILRMLQDPTNRLSTFVGEFSDFLYLPKRYWTESTIQMFELCAKYNVFLEIAIPSVINTIERDQLQYVRPAPQVVLWGEEARSEIHRPGYIESKLSIDCALNDDSVLFIHPIKLSDSSLRRRLIGQRAKKKCIVITTINRPNSIILAYSQKEGWDLIVVADAKTPDSLYKQIRCIFLDIETQKEEFPTIADLIPYNSYTRKNIGYLWAIKNGYQLIYETDDDNITEFLDSEGIIWQQFDQVDLPGNDLCCVKCDPSCAQQVAAKHGGDGYTFDKRNGDLWIKGYVSEICPVSNSDTISGKADYAQKFIALSSCNDSFVNIYNYYTDDKNIYPRGLPLRHPSIGRITDVVRDCHEYSIQTAVRQGLVNGDADVDATYRLSGMSSPDFKFEKNSTHIVQLRKGTVSPWNSQNTYWFNSFDLMYLPVTVSFRYTDILRSITSLFNLWQRNQTVEFTGPTAFQTRNVHDLEKDRLDEEPMYATIERVVQLLQQSSEQKPDLIKMYQLLAEVGVVKPNEIEVVTEWTRLCNSFYVDR